MSWLSNLFERSKLETRLQEVSAYTRSLIEASLDPLVTISPDGKITDVNKATEEITGIARERLIGSDFSNYFTEPDKARQGYQQVLATGLVRDYPLSLRHASGKITDVTYNASIFRDQAGEVRGVFAAARDITERKKLETRLTESSAYTRSLIEASLDPLVTISPEGKITDVNRATEEITGVPRERLVGSDFSNYFTEPDKARQGYQQVLATGLVRDYPLSIRHASGKITDVTYNASIFKNAEGEVQGVFAAARDITERKKLETRLTEVSAYTRSLIEASLDPLVTISPEGKVTDVNEATIKVTGVPRDNLIGTDFSNYFTEPEKAQEGYQQVFTKGAVTDYPLTIRHKDGRLTDVLYNASVYKDTKGNVIGVFAAARDVTETKAVMRDFAETKNYLDNILQSSTKYSIIGMDLNHRILSWNEGGKRNYGYTDEQIIGQDASVLHTPEDLQSGAVERLFSLAYEKGMAEGEFQRVRKNGSRFAASVVVTRRNDTTGRPMGYLLMSNDISEKKAAEEQVRQASQYARSLIESSLDPLVTISPEGKITDVNRATEEITGVPRERLIGSNFSNYFTEPDKAQQGYQRVLADGLVRDYPLSLRHASGKVTDVTYNASIFKNLAGEVQGVFAAARDMTELRVKERSERLENMLREAQAAVSVLTSSASDILSAISQLASGSMEAATSVNETTSTVEEVRQTAQLSNQRAREIADASQNAAQVLQTGQKSVEAAVTEMSRIRDQMGSIAENIITLSEQSQAIGEITGSVNELAEQSNLLAVNAAIEAAKAGDQGKGFAVVAQEIKNLAEQSKQATSQVRSLLADIQKAIGNAVMTTEQTSKVVETGVVQSSQAGEAIRGAVDATLDVARSSTQIAASSQQQLVGVDQVAKAMESINRASVQNAQSTKQVEAVAQNLHELSQRLKSLVEQSQG